MLEQNIDKLDERENKLDKHRQIFGEQANIFKDPQHNVNSDGMYFLRKEVWDNRVDIRQIKDQLRMK